MPTIYEWFGYRASDNSDVAATSAMALHCPFLDAPCTKAKSGGVCSNMHAAHGPVIICPNRMLGDSHIFLRRIAHEAFEDLEPRLELDGLPAVVAGPRVREVAAEHGQPQVGIFGKRFGKELKLPAIGDTGARYSVDYTLVLVDGQGKLLSFAPVELQTIDITGSNSKGVDALQDGRRIVDVNVGLNWENVNKRIIPQLITKGLMLQAEPLCKQGIFFACPEPIYSRIMSRLGGARRLRNLPKQPGSITFLPYVYLSLDSPSGDVAPIAPASGMTVSTSDLSIAFITPENLPEMGAYEKKIREEI